MPVVEPHPDEVTAFKADIVARYKAAMESVIGFPEEIPEWSSEEEIQAQWEEYGSVLAETICYPVLWWILNPPSAAP